jgi:diguanylate cyclase (GGDEF)-like protein/PAS domain S-box-containing protein
VLSQQTRGIPTGEQPSPKNGLSTRADAPMILIVDDDADMRFLLVQNMQRLGYRVAEAEDGLNAIELFQTVRPDLVLMDGLLPGGLDGFEACARMQQMPGGSGTPILMVTALNDNTSVEQAFKAGATDFITKPIHWAVLRQRVHRLLRIKRTEEALRLSDRTITAITNGLLITDPRQLSNPTIYVNSAFEKLTGYNHSDIIGQGWQLLHGPETEPALIEEITLAVEHERQAQATLVLYRKDSTPWWCDLSVFPVREEASGFMTNFVYVLHDISERKIAEEALRESESRYRTVVENLREVIFQIDLVGNWIFLNPAWTEITGFRLEETLGTNFLNYVASQDRRRNAEMVQPLFDREKEFVRYEIRFLTKYNGTHRWLEVYAQLTSDAENNVIGISGTLNDITERKQAEEALQQANAQLKRQVEELNRRASEIRLLSEMGGLFQVCKSPAEAYKLVSHMLPKLFPEASGTLNIIRPPHRLLETVAVWGNRELVEQRTLFDRDDCWALRRGQLHWVEGQTFGLVCKHVPEKPQNGWYICVPMMASGEALGVLHLYSQETFSLEEGERFGQSRRELATAVGEQIALALSNLKLQETLLQQSIRDPLTGLHNRRYFDEALEKEIRRAARKDLSVGVLMMDIDHFRDYNNMHGHDAGDAVLREIAGFVLNSVRNEDIACRYGGEEFVLVLPGITAELAEHRAQQLRNSVKNLKILHRGQALGTITISVGVAVLPQHASNGKNLLLVADKALYEAKQNGRDCVVVASSEDGG